MKKVPGILQYCCIHKFDSKAAQTALIISLLLTTFLPFVSAENSVSAGEGRRDRTEQTNKK